MQPGFLSHAGLLCSNLFPAALVTPDMGVVMVKKGYWEGQDIDVTSPRLQSLTVGD